MTDHSIDRWLLTVDADLAPFDEFTVNERGPMETHSYCRSAQAESKSMLGMLDFNGRVLALGTSATRQDLKEHLEDTGETRLSSHYFCYFPE